MISAERHLVISPNMDYEALARDEDLLFAARSGSHAAFAELQKTYSHRIYKRILSITRNREDAEDAVQDTFICAYLALRSFEGRSKFSTWLTRIAINSALTIVRKRRGRPEMLFGPQPPLEDDGISFDIRDSALNPEQLCDQKQRSYAIRRAIERLDPKSRTALRLSVSQELSVKEIAQNLGVSVASVKARLQRAKKRLSGFPEFRHAKASRCHCSQQNRLRSPYERVGSAYPS
jgi:RNA polymerase sigma-70 factor, ECF subfamily